MIDIDRVTQTKAGYPVVELFHYPNNPLAQRLVGIYEYNGQYECEYWFDDGTYWGKEMPQGMDLVEDSKEVTRDRETVKTIVDKETIRNSHVNSIMLDTIEGIYSACGVCLQDTHKEQ